MLHLSYYISVTFLQAVWPDFMRVFRIKTVENRANSDDFGLRPVEFSKTGSLPAVKTEYGIALAKSALAAERPKNVARIEVLVMFGNHQTSRLAQPRLRKKSKSLLIIAHLAVRRIEKTEVANHGLRVEHAQCDGGFTLDDFGAFFDAEGLQIVPDRPGGTPRRLNEIRHGRAPAQCLNADSSRPGE